MTEETHHEFSIGGKVIDLSKIDGQRFAVVEFRTADNHRPYHLGFPIERGKYLLGGDDVTITLSWSHGDEQTRMIALATGELDPATELDSDGNTPAPASEEEGSGSLSYCKICGEPFDNGDPMASMCGNCSDEPVDPE